VLVRGKRVIVEKKGGKETAKPLLKDGETKDRGE